VGEIWLGNLKTIYLFYLVLLCERYHNSPSCLVGNQEFAKVTYNCTLYDIYLTYDLFL
jgi:hypothetical protein